MTGLPSTFLAHRSTGASGVSMSLAGLFDLHGRRALVTVGNSGIGEAMATALGLAGARVLLVARREVELGEAARRLAAQGINATTLRADLAELTALGSVAQRADSVLGGVDTRSRRKRGRPSSHCTSARHFS